MDHGHERPNILLRCSRFAAAPARGVAWSLVHSSAGEPGLVAVARSLLLDREAASVVDHLQKAGVPTILLKGAAIATWLYDDGTPRPYLDIDILISPSKLEAALDALAQLGYKRVVEGAHAVEVGPKEIELIGPANVAVDLHHGLLGASAPSELCWAVLARRTVPLRLAGVADVPVLDVPARAMHLALHAAQNGPIDVKAIADLERGLSRIDKSDWREAALVAADIGAEQAFAAGLRLVPDGRQLADELSLTREMTVELALRTRSVTQDALFFERLAMASGLAKKAVLILRKCFPTAGTMRANSALARRGSLGLLFAWMCRPFLLVRRFVPAIVAWKDARRGTLAP